MHSEGEGSGSTFFFEIPLYRPRQSEPANAHDVLKFSPVGTPRERQFVASIAENGSERVSVRRSSRKMWPEDEDNYDDFDQQVDERSETHTREFAQSGNDEDESHSARSGCKNVQGTAVPGSASMKSVDMAEILRGKKVLIVDDAVMIRKLLNKTLTSRGAVCTEAEDGIHALRKIFVDRGTDKAINILDGSTEMELEMMLKMVNPDTIKYDIILMDFVMPNLGESHRLVAVNSHVTHTYVLFLCFRWSCCS
jgi:CheY-like chemotaxis protein